MWVAFFLFLEGEALLLIVHSQARRELCEIVSALELMDEACINLVSSHQVRSAMDWSGEYQHTLTSILDFAFLFIFRE